MMNSMIDDDAPRTAIDRLDDAIDLLDDRYEIAAIEFANADCDAIDAFAILQMTARLTTCTLNDALKNAHFIELMQLTQKNHLRTIASLQKLADITDSIAFMRDLICDLRNN